MDRIEADLVFDMAELEKRVSFWNEVTRNGRIALAYAEHRQPGEKSAWTALRAFIHASQVWRFTFNATTYSELRSAGELALIDDPELRSSLANYYVTVALRRGPGMYELLPEYRETVRGAVPSSIMRYYWTACHDQDQALQTLVECASPVTGTEVRRILEDIVSRPRLVPELRFWIDTLELMTRLAAEDIEAAEVLRGSVSGARQ